MTAPPEVVSFEATPVQQRLMSTMQDGVSRIIGFGGGVRGTKTFGSLASLIVLCRVFPGSRWAVIRKDLQRLRDTTLPSFEKLRQLTGGFVSPVNQGTWNATCRNGSQLLFRGENIDKDPELLRFHGYEVNGFLNEEADELSERTLVKEIERAGTWIIPPKPDGSPSEQPPQYILNTFNPCANWPRRRFYQPWRDQTIKPPYAFIPTTAADNPYISDAQRAAWKELPEHEYKRFVLGDWEALTGAYYNTLSPDVLIDPVENLPDTWRYWASFDWGYGHWAVMIAWATTEDGLDIALDSLWLRGQQDNELADAYITEFPRKCLREVYAGHDCWAEVKARGASGESTAEVFAAKGIMLQRADIDKVNGGRAVNRQLKARRVKICKTPGNLKGFDQLGEIMPDENDIRKPAKIDADVNGIGGDDWADAFRYGIATRVRPLKQDEDGRFDKTPHRARPLSINEDGELQEHPKMPRSLEELVSAFAPKRSTKTPFRRIVPPKR